MKRLSKTIIVLFCFLMLVLSSASAAKLPEAYHPIVQKYIDNYKSGNVNYGELGYAPEDLSAAQLYEQLGFGLDDWNGDGQPELLIGEEYNGKLIDTMAIYTLVNGAPQEVVKTTDHGENYGIRTSQEAVNDPSVAGCIVKDKFTTDSHTTTTEYYKMEGPNLTFVKNYTYADDETYSNPKYYTSTDKDNPLQTEIENPGDLIKPAMETNVGCTTFKNYDTSFENQPSNYEGPAGTIYRLNHPITNEHLYTSQFNEAVSLANGGWEYEGYAWTAPENGTPVYRLYNPTLNDHLYTTDENEINTLKNNGWQLDNSGSPLFYSDGSNPIYRLYHPGTGHHLLTTDGNEYTVLGGNGWNQEGTVLHCL